MSNEPTLGTNMPGIPTARPYRALFLGALSMTLAFASPALADDRSYVRSTGVDSGACASPSSPCRNFAYALEQTDGNGEIVALDSGGYDRFVIRKPITITAKGNDRRDAPPARIPRG